ncbi:MAG: thiamine phosphate synthase [Gammaproteobacteria bacterium]
MSKPICWTIAGSDSGGGAGIQADLHTFQALGVHGCSVIAALTAQNSVAVQQIEFVSKDMINAQVLALISDLPPRAIKMGMLGSLTTLQTLLPFLDKISAPIIYDPVLYASTGDHLHDEDIRDYLLRHFLSRVTLLTPNVMEAQWLLGKSILTNDDIEKAAHELLQFGPSAVLIKGGHAPSQKDFCQDFWTNGKEQAWLSSTRILSTHRHGGGCTLSSAITACLALDYPLIDALVIAKAYVNQGLRLAHPIGKGPGAIAHQDWPTQQNDFPQMSQSYHLFHTQFPSCGPEPLGFYPIVDNAAWVERLVRQGVKTIQLRIKNISPDKVEQELKISIKLATKYNVRLFINDYWQLAIKLGAYGVHLGQEDLLTADLSALQKAGLRLGISTHSYSEIARAHAVRPSYIAIGPIYPTTTKKMPFAPQGLLNLKRYCNTLNYPIVAIGGISRESLHDVLQTGVDGVAVISAITSAAHPDTEIKRWVDYFNNLTKLEYIFSENDQLIPATIDKQE